MKKLLLSIMLVLSLTLSPLSWAGSSDPVIEGKSATDINIDGGAIDNTPIGSGTPQTGAFTTLGTTGDATVGTGGDPADAGAIRLKNADKIMWEASPAGADIEGIAVDANEIVQIGAAGASGVTITPAVTLNAGTSVNEFSIDGTLAGDSDDAVPTEKAVKTYADTKAAKGVNTDITSMTGISGVITAPTNLPTKTTAAWSKTIGATGDYATFAAMMTAMPDFIAHAVTVTIQTGTTLTEICNLKNKHGLTSAAQITVQAEKYYPTASVIPTADSATATTLRDAELATAALGDDYFNDCWVFVVDGTGTDNGFVLITDYVDATGDIVVASWPGTQSDNTSRYIIVGALIDGQNTQEYGFDITNNTSQIFLNGIGVKDIDYTGSYELSNFYTYYTTCGFYNCDRSGIDIVSGFYTSIFYCGLVNNNTDSSANFGGISASGGAQGVWINYCGLSDNNIQGIKIRGNSYAFISNNFGDGNGTWGAYANNSGQANVSGTECSGASGNHSDPGTAGNANADQAAAY